MMFLLWRERRVDLSGRTVRVGRKGLNDVVIRGVPPRRAPLPLRARLTLPFGSADRAARDTLGTALRR